MKYTIVILDKGLVQVSDSGSDEPQVLYLYFFSSILLNVIDKANLKNVGFFTMGREMYSKELMVTVM